MKSLIAPLWTHPHLHERIDQGIENYRKSNASLHVIDAKGRPVCHHAIAVRQEQSSFHFGGNIFMLGGYLTTKLNQRYEDRFCELFNAATVPFYWNDLEPQQGRPRYTANSPFRSRRPPPDVVATFCQTKGLRMHGHTLVWDHAQFSVPDWLPESPSQCHALWEKRICEIGERYGHIIPSWDVLNEAVPNRGLPISRPMPGDYEQKAFALAQRYFPSSARLDINDIPATWTELLPRYVELIKRLIHGGANIGGLGLQFHLFGDNDLRSFLDGNCYQPEILLAALDTLGRFQKPIHISEITLTSPDKSPLGLEQQAAAARALYRLWFSHPAVGGITWWNVPDGGAAPGEDRVYSGLLDAHIEPKPAYRALQNLIQHEWRTHVDGYTNDDGRFHFRGFHGKYRLQMGSQLSMPLELAPTSQPLHLTIRLDQHGAILKPTQQTADVTNRNVSLSC